MDSEPKDVTPNIPASDAAPEHVPEHVPESLTVPEATAAPSIAPAYTSAPVVNPFFTRGCCEIPKLYHKNDKVFQHNCSKFDTHDWLNDLPLPQGFKVIDIVEVQFKNNRKDFYRLPPDISVEVGDIVAVEASPGHDIGIISMEGEIVRFQLHKKKVDPLSSEIKKYTGKPGLLTLKNG